MGQDEGPRAEDNIQEGRKEKKTNVLRGIQTKHNRFVQPVQLMSPGQIMRIRSLLGALVHARKGEIKQLA